MEWKGFVSPKTNVGKGWEGACWWHQGEVEELHVDTLSFAGLVRKWDLLSHMPIVTHASLNCSRKVSRKCDDYTQPHTIYSKGNRIQSCHCSLLSLPVLHSLPDHCSHSSGQPADNSLPACLPVILPAYFLAV